MKPNQIICGECIEELKKLPENSVDAIVTDPPYGLGFMNKEWDSPKKHRELVEREKRRSEQRKAEGKSPTDAPFSQSVMPGLAIKGAKEGRWFQEWCEQWSKELFRVLKPGGYFLSFSATRMYHRMVCGIEDAGFEIRDTISWIYSTGFPKSLNVGKAIDKMQGNERENLGFKKGQGNIPNDRGEWGLKPNTPIEITKGNTEWEGWGTSLKPAWESIVMAQKPLNTLTHIDILCRLIGYVKDVEKSLRLKVVGLKEEKELIVVENVPIQQEVERENSTATGKVEDLKGVMDISQFSLKEANTNLNMILLWKNLLEEIYNEMSKFTISMEKEMITDLKILNSLLGQVIQENIIHQQKSQVNGLNVNALLVENTLKSVLIKSRLLNITSVQENVISKEKNLDLSSNASPIVVARKPLSEKNVALNVLKWGTGGINIDACRIGYGNENDNRVGTDRKRGDKEGLNSTSIFGCTEKGVQMYKEGGRFPANLILDEEAGKMLDEQSGESKSSKVGFKGIGWKHSGNTKEEMTDLRYQQEFKDKGGASRFFYCPKASKSERNYGCEELEEKKQDSSRKEGNPCGDNPRNRGVHLRKNNHPTVKPIALMEYLIKLVSREGATILDPFLGSGTTGIAAVKLCRNFIGIEKEEEYVKIAQARLKPFLEQQRLQ